jgi:hypothetical protein
MEVELPKECGWSRTHRPTLNGRKEKAKEEGSQAPGTGKEVVDMAVQEGEAPKRYQVRRPVERIGLGEIVTEGQSTSISFPTALLRRPFCGL